MSKEQKKADRVAKMQRPFEEIKESLMEEVILHLRDPKHFGVRKLSHEEISILLSPSEDRSLSRMTYCTDEKNALLKMKNGLEKVGIKSVADVFDPSKGQDKAISSAYLRSAEQ
jgi:hypothetical protein